MYQLIVVFLFFVIGYYLYTTYTETNKVQSKVDNQNYILRNNFENYLELEKNADTLAQINQNVLKLINYMENKYTKNNDLDKLYFVRQLKKRYNPSTTLSEAAIDVRYTTYTIDKQDIHVCLRTRNDKKELYDMDILMYVLIHELAHMANYSKDGQPILGHGPQFVKIFKFFVKDAIETGVYAYTDYTKKPKEYCGMVINTNIVN